MRQTKTLFFLSDGPRRMSDVARRLRVETPSATSMIDRLAAKGLVERGQDPADRRAVVCSLTQAGMDAIEEFWAQRTARTESLAEVLSTEELEVVVPALEIMADAARRARSKRRMDDHESHEREATTVEADA
jgi:DNA-binding MarR family transcriptional regulator